MKALAWCRCLTVASDAVIIRQALPEDGAALLDLMQQLAVFEGYRENFRVTLDDLSQRLFERQDFCVLVAEVDGQLAGMLVYYFLPFSYDLTPWILVKELFVAPGWRGKNIGQQLMVALAQHAVTAGSHKIRWDVLATNDNAKAFYRALGAQSDDDWELFSLSRPAIEQLAAR